MQCQDAATAELKKNIHIMAQKDGLPAFNMRGQWRFRRSDINTWIEEQKACS